MSFPSGLLVYVWPYDPRTMLVHEPRLQTMLQTLVVFSGLPKGFSLSEYHHLAKVKKKDVISVIFLLAMK